MRGLLGLVGETAKVVLTAQVASTVLVVTGVVRYVTGQAELERKCNAIESENPDLSALFEEIIAEHEDA